MIDRKCQLYEDYIAVVLCGTVSLLKMRTIIGEVQNCVYCV